MTLEILLPWLCGFIGVPIVNFIKTRLNLFDGAAVWLTVVVSVALAAAALAATGGFTADSLPGNFAIVFATATVAYKLLPVSISSVGS